MLQEQERRLAGADGEVLLDFLPLLAAERRIGHDHVHAVLVLDVRQVLGQRVGVEDVRRVDPVQDHVHDPDHIGQRLFLLAEKSGFQEVLSSLVVRLFLALRKSNDSHKKPAEPQAPS